jgi:hypothetical protein
MARHEATVATAISVLFIECKTPSKFLEGGSRIGDANEPVPPEKPHRLFSYGGSALEDAETEKTRTETSAGTMGIIGGWDRGVNRARFRVVEWEVIPIRDGSTNELAAGDKRPASS